MWENTKIEHSPDIQFGWEHLLLSAKNVSANVKKYDFFRYVYIYVQMFR